MLDDDDEAYELGILCWALVVVMGNLVARKIAAQSVTWAGRAKAYPRGSAKENTSYIVVASTAVGYLHATFVTVMAARVLMRLDPSEPELNEEAFGIWRGAMQVSMGFFIGDIFMYCLPLGDHPITSHHVVLFSSHVGVGSRAVMHALAPPHLSNFIMWASAAGYLCEGSNLFLNNRWFMLQFLKEHRPLYLLNNILLLLAYLASRVVWFPYIMHKVYEQQEAFAEGGHLMIWYFMLTGYVLTLLMSLMWLQLMLKNGVAAFVVIKAKSKKKSS
mmetsp:Transcript_11672/g.35431  ORF Transcript_11672/g.35431 Transcript_11672/m.35431 type:complete len:274 (-) Transcript_11672:169-990(-)